MEGDNQKNVSKILFDDTQKRILRNGINGVHRLEKLLKECSCVILADGEDKRVARTINESQQAEEGENVRMRKVFLGRKNVHRMVGDDQRKPIVVLSRLHGRKETTLLYRGHEE